MTTCATSIVRRRSRCVCLAFAFALFLVAGSADGARLTGAVLCDDCAGGVGVAVHGEEGTDGLPLAVVGLLAPGPFDVSVPDDAAIVHVFAFRDADSNGVPDPGGGMTGWPGNPLALAGIDHADLDIVLAPLGPAYVTVAGVVTCAACAGGVGVVAYADASTDADVLGGATLLAPGPYAIDLAPNAGPVHVYAYVDGDADGVPDPGADLVAHAGNPIEIGTANVTGVDLDLSPLAPGSVFLGGTVTCASCSDSIGVRVEAEGGGTVALLGRESPGPWRIDVAAGLGAVDITAFRDADRNGVPDAGEEAVPYAGNPILVGYSDIAGLDIALPSPDVPSLVALSGAVLCGDCPGGVGVALFGAGGAQGPLVQQASLSTPGPFALFVPPGLGEAHVFAFRDADGDGVPDNGTGLAACPLNPLEVQTTDLPGLDVLLPPAQADTVLLSGTIACLDCTGGVGVRVLEPGGPDGAVVGEVALVAPGPYAVAVPRNAGPLSVLAFRDADHDGAADAGTGLAAYGSNPVVVGDQDVGDIDVHLPALAATEIAVRGVVRCTQCPGGVTVRLSGAGGVDGPLLAAVGLAGPGPFAFRLMADSGEVHVFAQRDADGDGIPDPGAALVGYPGNPLQAGLMDLNGIDIDLDIEPSGPEDAPDAGIGPDDAGGGDAGNDAGTPDASDPGEPVDVPPLPDDTADVPLPDDTTDAPLPDDTTDAPPPDDTADAPLPDDLVPDTFVPPDDAFDAAAPADVTDDAPTLDAEPADPGPPDPGSIDVPAPEVEVQDIAVPDAGSDPATAVPDPGPDEGFDHDAEPTGRGGKGCACRQSAGRQDAPPGGALLLFVLAAVFAILRYRPRMKGRRS